MSHKDVKIKSMIFLIIGILLILSLVICVYIHTSEKDLVLVKATVIKVKKDNDGIGKNDVTVSYNVDNTSYLYNFNYKDNIKVGDTIEIYYHKNKTNLVQTYKTGYIIFLWPSIGLILCFIGLFELFSQKESNSKLEVKTELIKEEEDTQTLQIILPTEDDNNYYEDNKEEVEIKKIISKEEIIKSNYFYISNDTLVYKNKKELEEINIKDIETLEPKLDKNELLVFGNNKKIILLFKNLDELLKIKTIIHNKKLK